MSSAGSRAGTRRRTRGKAAAEAEFAMLPGLAPVPGFVPHYRLLLAGLGIDEIDRASPRCYVATGFLEFLIGEVVAQMPFDAAFYARAYPDVAAAVTAGRAPSCEAHYRAAGFREGRLPHELAYDPAFYRAHNPDLHTLYANGGDAALADHYRNAGRHEGRAAHAAVAAEARRWTEAAAATGFLPAARTMEQAQVLAYAAPLVAPPPDGFRGGLVLRDTAADRRLRHRRDRRTVDSFPPSDTPSQVLRGEYVYAGPYYHHFGHVMAETIHRILPSREVFPCRRLLFVGTGTHPDVAGFDALPPAMQAPLAFLQVDPADVTVIHDNRIVEKLHVTEQGSTLTGGPNPRYLSQLTAFATTRLNELFGDQGAGEDKIYVSRGLVKHGGNFLGERYLEALLAAEGYRILHPETVSLAEQMNLYRRAGTVIFGEGSACHGVELMGAGMLGQCVLLVRRADHRATFERVLRPRARQFDALMHALPLGSLAAGPDDGAPVPNLGVSLFDFANLAESLRALGVALLPKVDLAAYRVAAEAELADYESYHRAQGSLLGDGPARDGFRQRWTKAWR